MSSLLVKVNWSTLRGTNRGTEEIEIDIGDSGSALQSHVDRAKSAVSRTVVELVKKQGFVGSEFQDLVINTIEVFLVTEKDYFSLTSMGLQDKYESAILERLRELAHQRMNEESYR